MPEKSSVFDLIGPVMIGPSSSHTAGVVRIGLTAKLIHGEPVDSADITFYNSFARTYEGHGSDRAIIAGILNFKTDDERIKESFKYAKDSGLRYSFKAVGNASTFHPNTVKVVLTTKDHVTSIIGESRGGGVIRIKEVNEFDTNITASSHTMIIKAQDIKGSISYIANILALDDCNIATMTVSRKGKNDTACLAIEMDSEIRPLTLEYLKNLNWIYDVMYLPVIKI